MDHNAQKAVENTKCKQKLHKESQLGKYPNQETNLTILEDHLERLTL